MQPDQQANANEFDRLWHGPKLWPLLRPDPTVSAHFIADPDGGSASHEACDTFLEAQEPVIILDRQRTGSGVRHCTVFGVTFALVSPRIFFWGHYSHSAPRIRDSQRYHWCAVLSYWLACNLCNQLLKAAQPARRPLECGRYNSPWTRTPSSFSTLARSTRN